MSAGIYRITNNITGAVYIGYTTNLEKRKTNYKTVKVDTQPLIFESLKTYGYENHTFDVLYDFGPYEPTDQELRTIETNYIKYYRYEMGALMLNTNDGGGGSSKWNEERKANFKKLRRGKSNKRAVLQYSEDGKFIKRWDSITAAKNLLGVNYLLVMKACREKYGLIGGYQWRHDEHQAPQKVVQYTMDGDEIKVWDSLTAAADGTKIIRQSINNTCVGIQHSCGGFKWGFKKEKKQNIKYQDIEPYKKHLFSKKILQYSLEGKFIREWDSMIEARQQSGDKYGVDLYANSKKSRVHLYNRKQPKYQWLTKTSDEIKLEIPQFHLPMIAQYDIDGKFMNAWTSKYDMERDTKLHIKSILGLVNFKGGFAKARKFYWLKITNGVVPDSVEVAKKIQKERQHKIVQYDLYGNEIGRWFKSIDIEESLGINSGSISGACSGKLKTAGKFQWRYVENAPEKLPPIKIIEQYDLDGNFIRDWFSTVDIKNEFGFDNIGNALARRDGKGRGFVWKYKK